VTDDFGLDDARLICELPGQEPIVLARVSPDGATQCSLTHVLELEQYNLHVGDGILFYATAQDVRAGLARADANAACSEIYFIEIRPYRSTGMCRRGANRRVPSPCPLPKTLSRSWNTRVRL